ncbi:MAG: hypothetical protein ABI581_08530 [Sediminibacterium sp.]
MKKTRMLVTIGMIVMLLNSCKKEALRDPMQKDVELKVTSWIESKTATMTGSKENVELLKRNLDYANMHLEEASRGEKIAVIPILDEYKSARQLSQHMIPNLIVYITNAGDVRSANIVFFKPENTAITSLPANAMHNIRTTAENVPDGQYKFFTIMGARLYQLGYKGGKLASEGIVKSGSAANAPNVLGTKPQDAPRVTYAFECVDLYLVTHYYDENGNYLFTGDRQYLGRFGNCAAPGEWQVPQNDPNGGGGEEVPEEYEYAKSGTKTMYLSTLYAIGYATTMGACTISAKSENNQFTSASAGTTSVIGGIVGWTWSHYSSSANITNPTTIAAAGKGFYTNPSNQSYESSGTQNFSHGSFFP